jgi:glycosyltransferase involved in cell wall biosynthesis
MRYAVVTPARNEAENLGRLAQSLADQTAAPSRWIVVDTGSSDDTPAIARSLLADRAELRLVLAPESGRSERGAPIVRGFEAGVDALDEAVDVVVKVDADVSFGPDYFERLLAAFAADDSLGIASGNAEEFDGTAWRPRRNTGTSVWGAARAYRRECLEAVRPLERSMGWDGIDELKAHLRGWRTETLAELPFRHHRPEGVRDGATWRAWSARGRASHYMGYRAWYLAARAGHHARTEPTALAMIWGYTAAALMRRPTCSDPDVRAELRRTQSLRSLRGRRREALGAPR